jgi:hypothetical protein
MVSVQVLFGVPEGIMLHLERDDVDFHEARTGLEVMQLHCLRVLVERPFDFIADFIFGLRLGGKRV